MEIAQGFGAMYQWAGDQGLQLGRWKVDIGYRPEVADAAHELFIDIV